MKLEDFQKYLPRIDGAVAVAVSGGPDSMALLKLLSESDYRCHALIVDHGLRQGSAQEARSVSGQIQDWSGVSAHILTWGGGADSRIQEDARNARYELMAEHCAAHNIRYLFLGHHMDDQAETVLFRLAKGSGLDGLAGISEFQTYSSDLTLVRPLLNFLKSDLIAFCEGNDVPYMEDPSNSSENFARVRLRRSARILAQEGLSAKRLSVTARRISRARKSLESLADQAFEKILLDINTNRIVLNEAGFQGCVEEVRFRVILKAIKELQPHEDYLPRMEKIETIFDGLQAQDTFRKRTLGGLIFERDDKKGEIIISKEHV